MPQMFWTDIESFVAELPGASDDRLRAMREWATRREQRADRSGMGRNPKARRMFRQFRIAAEEELDRRGLLWE